MTKNVYLAAPFFSPQQKERIQAVREALEANPTIGRIFEPEAHPYQEAEFGSLEWQKAAFMLDTNQIYQNDIMVAIVDYKMEESDNEADSGTMFEVGLAYGTHTPVIIVQFDPQKELNLMIRQAMTAYFDASQNGLIDLKTYDFDVMMPHFNNNRDVI